LAGTPQNLELAFQTTNEKGGSKDRENFGWVKKFKDRFFIGKKYHCPVDNTKSPLGKVLRSGWQACACIGTKQIACLYALSGNFLLSLFLTVSDVAPKPCNA